jgi:hypothetical protein
MLTFGSWIAKLNDVLAANPENAGKLAMVELCDSPSQAASRDAGPLYEIIGSNSRDYGGRIVLTVIAVPAPEPTGLSIR